MHTISVGSQNHVKHMAVQEAFSRLWPNKQWKIIGVNVSSGVSDQPMSDKESIEGAATRAKESMKQMKTDFSVGLEGGLQYIDDKWYESGWAVVINKKGTIAIGSSIKMYIPDRIFTLIKSGKELGEASDIIFKKKNTKKDLGYFGLMTNGKYTRKDAYRDGVISALTRFLQPEIFEN